MPFPGCVGCRILAGQGRGHGNRDMGVGLVEVAHLLEVGVEALAESFLIGQEGHSIAVGFGVTDGDERILKVKVLDAQAQGLQEAQAASIEEAGNEIGCAVEMGEDAQAFVMAEVGLN